VVATLAAWQLAACGSSSSNPSDGAAHDGPNDGQGALDAAPDRELDGPSDAGEVMGAADAGLDLADAGARPDTADASDAADAGHDLPDAGTSTDVAPASDAGGGADAPADAGPLLPWSAIRPCSVFTNSFNTTAALAPDASTFTLGGGAPGLFDATSGAPVGVPLPGLFGPAVSVAYSPDGHLLAAGSPGGALQSTAGDLVVAWRVPGGSVAWRLSLSPGVTQVAFSPDSTRLAVASNDGTVRLVNAATGAIVSTYAEHTSPVLSVTFSLDGTLVASGSTVASPSGNAEARVWRVSDLHTTTTVTAKQPIMGLAFSPDGAQLLAAVGGSNGDIRWRLSDGATLPPTGGFNGAVAFAPDGQSFFEGQALYRTSDGVLLLQSPVAGAAQAAAYTTDGARIFELSAANHSVFWTLDANTQKDVTPPLPAPVTPQGSVSPDGTRLVMGEHAYELGTGATVTTYMSGTYGDDSPNAVSPDGTLIAFGAGAGIDLVPAAGGAALGTLSGHAPRTDALSFSPDGTMLASGGDDHRARIWNVATRSLVRTLGSVTTGHTGSVIEVSWSPDGLSLVSTGGQNDAQSIVWRVSDGTILHTFTGTTGAVFSPSAAAPALLVNTNAVTTDGGFNETGVSTLANATTFATLRTFTAHRSGINSLPGFSADGALVATPNNVETPIWSAADATIVARPPYPNGVNGSAVFAQDGVVIFGSLSAVYWCRH
jgi:WD40 repeat protein